MNWTYIPQTFADCVKDISGQICIKIPANMSSADECCYRITEETNELNMGTDAYPYALFVTDSVHPEDYNSEYLVSLDGAINFRSGDRLFITNVDIKALASLDAVRPVIGDEFPSDSALGAEIRLDDFARSALSICLSSNDIEIDNVKGNSDFDMCHARLHDVLVLLRESFERMGNIIEPWPAFWFKAVEVGLSQLSQALSYEIQESPKTEIYNLLMEIIYPAFSLPNPQRKNTYENSHKVDSAITDYWINADEIRRSLIAISLNLEEGEERLQGIDWQSFDTTAEETGNKLLAWLSHNSQADQRWKNFSSLTEEEFFNPYRELKDQLIIETSDHQACALHEISGLEEINLLPTIFDGSDIRSQEVIVRVPTHPSSTITAEEVQSSNIGLEVDDPAVEFIGTCQLEKTGSLAFQGYFLTRGDQNKFKFKYKKTRCSIFLPDKDALQRKVIFSASAILVLTPPNGEGALVFHTNNKRNPKLYGYGPTSFNAGLPEDPYEKHDHKTKEGTKTAVICWSGESASVMIDGEDIGPDNRLLNRFSCKELTVWETHTVSITEDLSQDNFILNIEKEIVSGPEIESPIIAAILKTQVSKKPPQQESRGQFLGKLETFYSQQISDRGLGNSNGHIQLAEGSRERLENLTLTEKGDSFNVIGSRPKFSVDDELLNSVEATEFRQAFDNLGIPESLVSEFDGDDFNQWPSKISWAFLSHDTYREKLQEYLDSYKRLVQKAQSSSNPSGRFWASYPFSTSIWNENNEECKAVFVGPLHPIRLAWLAYVEEGLRSASKAEYLAGTVEGWNFPTIGPGNNKNGRMLAIPIDSGPNQIFLSWSLLVKVSIDGAKPLSIPQLSASEQLPGASDTGLNRGSVISALTDYRRLHPYNSTMVIDLTANNETNKLHEIDTAILDTIQKWIKDQSNKRSVLKGVRVFDSLKRKGQFHDANKNKIIRSLNLPFSWKRYNEKEETFEANIRILQDSGIGMEVQESEGESYGIMGMTPFRRFEIPDNSLEHKEAYFSPLLSPSGRSDHFFETLAVLESCGQEHRKVAINIPSASSLVSRAQWTISGDAMMSPSVLSKLLEQNRNSYQIGSDNIDHMLWEWHPPFLGNNEKQIGVSTIDQRSSFSIARFPYVFQRQLSEILDDLVGREQEQHTTDIHSVLGSQGVGLSSLVAIGGSQVPGALGFYTVLKLLQNTPEDKSDRFVMPFDVCNNFLTALAGGQGEGHDRQRADLLLLELSDDTLTLAPVEIKFYGTGVQELRREDELPLISSGKLKEAIKQANSSHKLLSYLKENWDAEQNKKIDFKDNFDHQLQANAITAFVEASARLKPTSSLDRQKTLERFQNIADGSVNIKVASPIIAYFYRTASEIDLGISQKSVLTDYADGENPISAFICDPRTVFSEFNESESGLAHQKWFEVIEKTLGSIGTDIDPKPVELLPPTGLKMEHQEDKLTISWKAPTTSELLTNYTIRISPGFEPISTEETSHVLDEIENGKTYTATIVANYDTGENIESAEATIAIPEADGPEGPHEDTNGVLFSIGTLTDAVGGQKASADFWPSNTALNQLNMGVLGDLGTGKTQFLKALIYQLREETKLHQEKPVSFLILDYKKDYIKDDFLDAVGGVRLDPEQIPLDLFQIEGEKTSLKVNQKAKAFIDVLDKIYGGTGPVQQGRLLEVLTELIKKSDTSITMNQVFEHYKEANDGKLDSVSGILQNFVYGETFSENKSELKTMSELMENNVVVLNLGELGTDQDQKNALVALFLNQYYEYMLKLPKHPYRGTDPQLRTLNSFLLVDEAVGIMKYKFDVLMTLLTQAREFGVGVILSSQYLSHFNQSGSVDYKEPLLTWAIHKVPDVSEKQLNGLGINAATKEMAEKISSLPTHHAFYKSLNYEGRFIEGTPFFKLVNGQ